MEGQIFSFNLVKKQLLLFSDRSHKIGAAEDFWGRKQVNKRNLNNVSLSLHLRVKSLLRLFAGLRNCFCVLNWAPFTE